MATPVAGDHAIPVYFGGVYVFTAPCPIANWDALRARAAVLCGVAVGDQKWAALEFSENPRVRPLDEKGATVPDALSIANEGDDDLVVLGEGLPSEVPTPNGPRRTYWKRSHIHVVEGAVWTGRTIAQLQKHLQRVYGTKHEFDVWAPVNDHTREHPGIRTHYVRVDELPASPHVDMDRATYTCKEVKVAISLHVDDSKFAAWSGRVAPGTAATTVLRRAEAELGLGHGYLSLRSVDGQSCAQVFAEGVVRAVTTKS